jgi:hypothetical protein
VTDDVEAFERATRRGRRIKVTLVIVIALLPLGWVIWKNFAVRRTIARHEEEYRAKMALTASDKTELERSLVEARKAIEAGIAKFSVAVTPETLSALEDSGSPCPVRVTAPTMGAGDSYVKYGSIDGNYFGNASYRLVAPGVPITSRAGYELEVLDDVQKRYAAGSADKNDLDRVRRLTGGASDEIFVVGTRTDPIVLGDSYEPGTVSGFVYVYSHRAGKVVCFAALTAQNTPQIEINYSYMKDNYTDELSKKRESALGTLSRDLEVQVRTQIAARLHATL